MKIRSYKGPSLEKLYETIHRELGPEAVVVCPEGGSGSGFSIGRRQHELIAIVDDNDADHHLLSSVKAHGSAEIQKLSMEQSEKWAEMERMFNELKKEIRNVANNPAAGADGSSAAAGAAGSWDPRFLKLVNQRVPDAMRNGDVAPSMFSQLSELLNIEESFPLIRRDRKPHIIAVTGPTGSGKTTTLAKLAAKWCLEERLKVGIITTDTYRVAAVDQTKEYATLLGLELRIVFSPEEAGKAVAAFKDKDVILVDTPGRNYYDHIGMNSLKGILRSMGPVTTLLLIPAALDRGNVSELIRSYRVLEPDYVVVTKVDETHRYSVFTTIACETDRPVVFVTNGQRVPKDIAAAKRMDVVEMITGRRTE